MPTIRKAELRDALRLAELAESTFRDTFGALNTAEDMALHCRSYYGEALQAAEIASADGITLVSAAGQQLVGYAQLRWGRAPACVSGRAAGEIQRLYVARDWHGKGVARELMEACIEALVRRGSDVLWLGVWERNLRAIAFYRKYGFVAVGDHVFPLGRDPQRDIVMARSVTGLAST
ncbi:MAG TPA: GNAT family N-acetyltransferase [Candidatus Dormibacteraeota bacterium]|nr:GNAT family N-acetyltransferase [Candidatus Dormibacteraeota bacterium]